MKRFWTLFYLCITGMGTAMPAMARRSNETVKTVLWGKPDAFLERQAIGMFDLVNQALAKYPPVKGGQAMPRKLALFNLDALLHETRYDKGLPLKRFMTDRITSALKDMSHPVKEGARIYKLYNDGFVVRTASVTFAFDLYRGNGLISDSLMQAVADQCDVLFISHMHEDHADPLVAEMFIKAGKPVVAPGNLWAENTAIRHIRSEKQVTESISVRNKMLQIDVLPGHQDEVDNNIYVVTSPENLRMAHTGDQYNEEDMKWIASVKSRIPSLDVLLVNCWTLRLKDFVQGFDPQLILSGHENEMGHTIDHREPYWLSYQKLDKVGRDYVLMTWGECYQYNR